MTSPGHGPELVRRELNWDLTPAEALRLLRNDSHPVALFGTWAGGSDVVASEPVRQCLAPQPLRKVLDGWAVSADEGPRESLAGFGGGWIGYLGFGAAEGMLPAPAAPGDSRALPLWWFGFYDHVLRRDRSTGTWAFEALWTPERAEALERRFTDLTTRARDARPRAYACGAFRLNPSGEEHRSAVGRAIDAIREGEMFQANICLRLEARFDGDPLDAFCTAAEQLQPPYASFLRLPDGSVASLSPELFLRRTGTAVVTQPIKGTRPRPADEQAAAAQRELLMTSAKERAENTMIVDLMRNDLSRVCEPGSVVVPRMLEAEAHPGVWHLVSEVAGTLRPGTTDGDLVAATFPPGSVSGAPKVRAIEIIHELESTAREAYTGTIGYRSPVAGLELSVAIRTFEFCGDRVWLGSGGGITAGSDPAEEFRECLLKAAPLVAAIGAEIKPEGATEPGAGLVSASLRPRAAAGVFTTLRIEGGLPADLDAHLSRLETSTRRLFAKRLPVGLRAELIALAAGHTSARLRVTARPVGGPLHIATEITALEALPTPAVTLHTVVIPGGLGVDKWADRRLLAQLTDSVRPAAGGHLLLLDSGGDILETDRANVFAVIDGVLRTPAADGRILPGITRATVLELAERAGITCKEAPLGQQELAGATEVFVTNSLRGITPVSSVTGVRSGLQAGPIAGQLQALLGSRPTEPRRSRLADPKRPTRRRPIGQGKPLIVLIDNYDSFTYNLAHLLAANNCQVEVIRNDEVSAQGISALQPAGIVISPGPCTPAEAGVSVETIRLCGPTTPVLGICLGHQAIGTAYGARIIRAPQPVHGQAWAISHDGQGVLRDLPQNFAAGRYHSLVIEETSLAEQLTVTARTIDGLLMGIRHRQFPIEGVQFHPESILTPAGHTIVRNFVNRMTVVP